MRAETVRPVDAGGDAAELPCERAPLIVVWEAARPGTRAVPDPRELGTLEAMRLMNQVRRFGTPLFVLAGAPGERPDLADLVEHARRIGLPVLVSPTGPPLPTDGVQAPGTAGPTLGAYRGEGLLEVGATGEIRRAVGASGCAGNVRTHDVVEVYRDAGPFRARRDPRPRDAECHACALRPLCSAPADAG